VDIGFDACVEFPPHGRAIRAFVSPVLTEQGWAGELFDYEETVLAFLDRNNAAYSRYPCVFPSWDNTPRQPLAGAIFDRATHTWVARVRGSATSGTIRVPQHGFTDRWGNTSGPAVTLRIGKVASQPWPPVMPVGGFCVPGPLGRGCFWPQAVYPWPPGRYPPGGPANGTR